MDNRIRELLDKEKIRQEETLQMIPSENYTSEHVMELVGSVLANKYSEGYAGRRYYQGNEFIDDLERLAVTRAKKLFDVPHANVQPYSGSPANSAVLFALLETGDTLMGMELASGGHLTHGQPKITFSGKYFNSVQFGVGNDGTLDYFGIERLAIEKRPKLIIVGTTAFPRTLDWEKFSEIAKTVGAWFVADISHVAGLVIGGVYPSPVEFADVITTTTHKTLRGPRGAIVMATGKGLAKDPELGEKLDRAVFPGLQGGPHNNTTAGIAQALYEASAPEFKNYAKQVVKNAQVLAQFLQNPVSNKLQPLVCVSGGTDCHLLLIDLKPLNLSGNVVAEALEVAGIIVNKNSVPGDTSPFYPSGIRIGTPSLTSRNMGEDAMKQIAQWILKVASIVKAERLPEEKIARSAFLKEFKTRIKHNQDLLSIAEEIKEFVKAYPLL